MAQIAAAAQPAPPYVLELPQKSFVVRTPSSSASPSGGLMSPTASRLWGARCGKSARRVLSGGAGTRSYAGSVRAPRRKRRNNSEAPQRLQASRPAPTRHSIPHDLVERAVAHHTDWRWVRLYVARWLRAPVQHADGTLEQRTKGTPQGGVASPLLANLFLHYAFDAWMQRTFPGVQFERYADDAIVHCRSERQAQSVLAAIRGRLKQCGLELHPDKTRIVYCKKDGRPADFEHIKFDFLGYTFQPRRAKDRQGKCFVSFLPAISTKSAKAVRKTIREWRMASTRNNQRLEDLARLTNPVVRGWMSYYGRYYPSKCARVLSHLNKALAAWVRRKYKRFRGRARASMHWLGCIAQRDKSLFVLWQLGVVPAAGE